MPSYKQMLEFSKCRHVVWDKASPSKRGGCEAGQKRRLGEGARPWTTKAFLSVGVGAALSLLGMRPRSRECARGALGTLQSAAPLCPQFPGLLPSASGLSLFLMTLCPRSGPTERKATLFLKAGARVQPQGHVPCPWAWLLVRPGRWPVGLTPTPYTESRPRGSRTATHTRSDRPGLVP